MLLLALFLVGSAAVAGGWLCRKAGVPEVLGYLGAGLLLSTAAGASLLSDVATVQAIATFAVVFRMFSLGLEFDRRRLVGRWRPSLFAGGLEMGACAVAGALAAPILGWTLLEGAVLGAALGSTSTGILTRALADRNEASRDDARAAGAATMAEDLIAMGLVALLAVFHNADGVEAVVESALWLLAFAALALTSGAILVPAVLDRVARTRSSEILTLAFVGVLFGFAALSEWLGAGRPIGAFLAGVAVGAARQAPGVADSIGPIRDVLAATFYVSAGLLLSLRDVAAAVPVALALVVVFVPLKVVATGIGLRLGGVPATVAARGGAILGQTGTLGIVAACQPFLPPGAFPRLFSVAFAAWAITVALTPVRLRHLPGLAERAVRALGARPLPPRSARARSGLDRDARGDAATAA
ncbi:MAG TPA: cation:proton antiporter, partial [Candidatus Thermoplasmatota archaeon]|nr:cation:proton antiporter [Candidatus Thermoplasmatota archaeon]